MPRLLVFGALLAATAWACPAQADVDLGVGNGDRIQGTLDPADSVEEYRVRVPKDAVISISVKGKKAKGKGAGPAPAMNFDLIGPDENVLDTGDPRGNGAKLKWTALVSGEYTVCVYGDGQNVGNYKASIKWKSRRKVPIAGDLTQADPTLTVPFDADAKSAIGLLVKAAKKSAALPRLATLNGMAIDPPDKASSKSHKVKRYGEPLGFGNATLVVTNAGADGAVTGKVTVKPPKSKKRSIKLTDKEIASSSGDSAATGEVLDEDGGLVEVVGEAFGEIKGSSVSVPPGALTKPTAIVISTSSPFTPKAEDVEGAGPATGYGPAGLSFDKPVEVTIVFDPAPFGGDFSTLRVFTESAKGKVTEILDFTVDVPNKKVSFFVTHFSAFRVFGPPGPDLPGFVRPDLNADGVADLILPAPESGAALGVVYVFFGGSLQAGDNDAASADIVVQGQAAGNRFGAAVLVRDATGDGVSDLIVSDQAGDGRVHLFRGGAGFSPDSASDADQRFSGEAGDDDFGQSVAVGDVNADGTLDLLVGGEKGDNAAGVETGAVWVFYGPFVGDELSSDADKKIAGEQLGDLFGVHVASADVTGDGIDDLVVGADMIDRAGATGAVYVFAGGADFDGRVVDADSAEIKVAGDSANDGFGLPLAVGLVDGDQVADIVVGQGVDNDTTSNSIYVIPGGAGLASGTATATSTARITGTFVGDEFAEVIRVQDYDATSPGSEIFVSAVDAGAGAGAVWVFAGVGLTSGDAATRSFTNVVGVTAGDTLGGGEVATGIPFDASIGAVFYASEFTSGPPFQGRAYVFPALPAPGTSADDATITVTGSANDNLGSIDD